MRWTPTVTATSPSMNSLPHGNSIVIRNACPQLSVSAGTMTCQNSSASTITKMVYLMTGGALENSLLSMLIWKLALSHGQKMTRTQTTTAPTQMTTAPTQMTTAPTQTAATAMTPLQSQVAMNSISISAKIQNLIVLK